jgi:hypothetical protein
VKLMCKALAIGAVLATTMLGACASDPGQGYAFSRPYRQDVQSISVPIFQNVTFLRGAEVRLTEGLIKELRRQTDWKVGDAAGAQTTLTGTITASELRASSLGRDTGLVEDQAVILTVDFEWKDVRTGKVLLSRRQFRASESFVPARGAGERIELAQNATIEALARDIVAEMRSSW